MKREINFVIHNLNPKKGLKKAPFLPFEGEIYEFGYKCKPIKGFTTPENFPNCCPFHKSIFQQIQEWFEKFPDCCDSHRQLLNISWFEKEKYGDVPQKVMTNLLYMEYFIESRWKNSNWLEDILNYNEYIFSSFGSPNVGGYRYLTSLIHGIEQSEEGISGTKNKNLF